MWQFVVLNFVFFVFEGQCRMLDGTLDEDLVKVVDLNKLTGANTRIIGGSAARIEDYNFAVQLLRNNRLSCGGSLLSTRAVLTSAHCFFDENGMRIRDSDFSVRGGTALLNSGGTIIPVRHVELHPRYNIPARDNDIAVVILRSHFNRSTTVDVASIPAPGYAVPDNQPVIHVGWGVTNLQFPVVSNVLQHVEVYTVNRTVCRNNYARLQMEVSNNMICAGVLGVGGRDACQGDSGGPLIWRRGNTMVVVGVTSWGYGCAHPDFPGVSAFVPVYTDWILKALRNNGQSSRIAGILLIASVISALLFTY